MSSKMRRAFFLPWMFFEEFVLIESIQGFFKTATATTKNSSSKMSINELVKIFFQSTLHEERFSDDLCDLG